MAEILPSTIQDWVTGAVRNGLAPTTVRKYEIMLHSVFKRAVRDRVILSNPCAGTELPKVPPRKARILTPEEYQQLLAAIPDRYRVLVMTDIETGLRWGELIALRPRNIDFLNKAISVEQTIVEVSRKHSPTGERMIVKDYPKDNEYRTLRVSAGLLEAISARIRQLKLGQDDLLFPSTESAPAGSRSPEIPSAAKPGYRHWRNPGWTSTSGYTTYATRTHPGSLLVAPTSWQSCNAWATHRS